MYVQWDSQVINKMCCWLHSKIPAYLQAPLFLLRTSKELLGFHIEAKIWNTPHLTPLYLPFFNNALWRENFIKFYSWEFAVVAELCTARCFQSQLTGIWIFEILERTTSTTPYIVLIQSNNLGMMCLAAPSNQMEETVQVVSQKDILKGLTESSSWLNCLHWLDIDDDMHELLDEHCNDLTTEGLIDL